MAPLISVSVKPTRRPRWSILGYAGSVSPTILRVRGFRFQFHLYWPDLDIDLAVESIEHSEKYPLGRRDRNLALARQPMVDRATGREDAP